MPRGFQRDAPPPQEFIHVVDPETGEVLPTPISANAVTNNTDQPRLVVTLLGPKQKLRSIAPLPPGKKKNNPSFSVGYIEPLQSIAEQLTKNEAALLFHVMTHLDYDGYVSVTGPHGQRQRLDVSGCESLLRLKSTKVDETLRLLEQKRVLIRESQGNQRWIRANPLYFYRGSRAKHTKACEQFNAIYADEMARRVRQRRRGRKKAE